MNALDYFVVGREVALQTRPHASRGGGPRLDLSVLAPPGREVGWVRTELRADHFAVELDWSDPRSAHRHGVETIRLAARVLMKLAPMEIRVAPGPTTEPSIGELLAEGFRREADGRWHLTPMSLFRPGARADDMESLYSEPHNVVWNFEPRPWDTLAPLLLEASRRDEMAVLDIGCGFGKNARLLEGLGVRVHGIDVARGAIARCREWVRHPERFVAASLDRLPHADASFEAVLDVGCLHCLPAHLLRPGIAEIGRVLKPGGWLFSRVLLPRDARWLEAQSYRVDRLGLDPLALARWLERDFEVGFTSDHQATHVRARRRG